MLKLAIFITTKEKNLVYLKKNLASNILIDKGITEVYYIN